MATVKDTAQSVTSQILVIGGNMSAFESETVASHFKKCTLFECQYI